MVSIRCWTLHAFHDSLHYSLFSAKNSPYKLWMNSNGLPFFILSISWNLQLTAVQHWHACNCLSNSKCQSTRTKHKSFTILFLVSSSLKWLGFSMNKTEQCWDDSMKNSFRIVNLDKLTNAFQVFSCLSKSQWKKNILENSDEFRTFFILSRAFKRNEQLQR